MRMTALKRVPETPPVPSLVDDEMTAARQDLMVQAERKLGYRNAAAVASVNYAKALARVCADGFRPFVDISVERYMDKKLRTLGFRREYRRWTFDGIQSYREPIPEFVLQTALKAKEAGYTVGIASMREDKDPFLYIECMGNRFFLEVWKEPDFNAKRVV